MSKRKPRSPLAGATKHQVEMIREAANTARNWDRRILTELISWPDFFRAKTPAGLSELLWYAERQRTAVHRSLIRLQARPDYDAIRENISLARLRDKNPAAYEIRMLRQQLADGSIDCRGLDSALHRLQNTIKS